MKVAAAHPTRAHSVLAYIDEQAANAKGAGREGHRAKVRLAADQRVVAARRDLTAARQDLKATRQAAKQAASGARQAKRAPFANQQGPVTVQDVRAAMPAGSVEPAYVSHQSIPARSAAVPVNPPPLPTKVQRTGEAVRQGTLDVHPAKLVEQAMGTQRLIDAAGARSRMIDDLGYRGAKDSPVQGFSTAKIASDWAKKNDLPSSTGVDWAPIRKADGEFALIPDDARQRLQAHEDRVNERSPVVGALSTQWRRNVLAFSPRWLFGNQIEGALRSLVAGAGPTSYVRAKRTLAAMDAEQRQLVEAHTIGGGNYMAAERSVIDRHIARDAEDLAGFARAVHALRRAPGVRSLADAYEGYTHIVFKALNGRLENQFQTAMLGKALRDSPLMDQHVVGLSRKAVEEAARGLTDTNTMVELGRRIDEMYGRYAKHSPRMQTVIANYTPFLPWTMNAINFLYHVLPRDHPVLTGLIASANTATEAWRKQHGQYMDFFGTTAGQVPGWLQGSIPGKDGSHLRVSRYTPFGLLEQEGGTPLSGLQSLVLPQLSEITANLTGKDWQGKELARNPAGARNIVAAAASFLEGQVPLASQAAHVTGARLPNMRDTQKATAGVAVRARETFDPFKYTPGKKPVAPRVRSTGGGATWGGGSTATWGG